MNGFVATVLAAERVSAFFGVAVFVATYWLSAPWWRTEVGRNIMTFVGSVGLLLGLGIVRQLIAGVGSFRPAYWGEGPLLMAALAVLNVGAWWRWWLLIQAQISQTDDQHR